MTMIVLIAIAAGCASALMFASIISGALISLAAALLRPAAADGGGARMGTACRHHRRHRRGHRPRRDLRPALLHRLCRHDGAARLVARAPRVAGTAGRQCRTVRQRRRAGRAGHGMVSDRPHPALDRRLRRLCPRWRPCSRWAPTLPPSPRPCERACCGSSARASAASSDEIEQRIDAAVMIAPARRRQQRHDHADAQLLAGRAGSRRHRDGCTARGPT